MSRAQIISVLSVFAAFAAVAFVPSIARADTDDDAVAVDETPAASLPEADDKTKVSVGLQFGMGTTPIGLGGADFSGHGYDATGSRVDLAAHGDQLGIRRPRFHT